MTDSLSTSVPTQHRPRHDRPVEREGAWSAPGTRTSSSWGTDPAARTSAVFRCVLRGELDFATRDLLVATAREFEASGLPSAEVDVVAVTFVDSTALEMLLSMRRTADDRGGDVVLLNPGRRLRRLLSVAGVAPLFSFDGASSA